MGKRSAFPRNKHDAYQTPYPAIPPIIPHLRAENISSFVEPCCGKGQLVDFLRCFGLDCRLAGDIQEGFDALTCDAHLLARADAIITNPPWTRAIMHPMIARFSLIAPTWLLFDADWAHTKQATPYLDYCSKIVSAGRLKWMPGTKHTGKDNAAWYRFDRRHTGGPVFFGWSSNQIEKSYAEVAA